MTYWDGVGAYTKDDVRVLCVCLSKYEIEELLHMVHSVDPVSYTHLDVYKRQVHSIP